MGDDLIMGSVSVRLEDDTLAFLNRLRNNINKVKTENNPDHKPISITMAANTIEKYFKRNNDRYLEMVEMEGENV